jgi:hypothetical protein
MEILRKDANNESLSYSPYTSADFEKSATEVDLSQDIRDWPATILQEFASEHPYAYQQTSPEIEFEKIDEKTGSAFGAIVLRKPYQVTGLAQPRERLEQEPEKVAVPVIVENFKLKSFEVFIRGEEVLPLTQNRYMEAGAGGGVAKGMDPYFQPSPLFLDKMIPPTVGYLGNLYGNYSLSGGQGDYSNWTPAKGAQEIFEPKLKKTGGSADPQKSETFLGSIIATINQSDYDRFHKWLGDERAICGFQTNKTLAVVREILGTKPTSHDDYLDFIEKAAPVHVVCLKRLSNGKWRCVTTNDYFYKPVIKEITAEDAATAFASIEPRISSLLQSSNEIILESPDRTHCNPVILEDHDLVSECVESDGHYLVVNDKGGIMEGQVFCRILDYNGNPFPGKLFIGGGAHSLQDDMVGQRMGDVHSELTPGSLEVGVEGSFVGQDETSQLALRPVKITNVGWINRYLVAQATGQEGEQIAFVMMPGVTRFQNATGISDSVIGGHIAGNIFFVPPSYQFVPLGKKIPICADPRHAADLVQKKIFMSERHLEPFSVETTRKGHSRGLRVISGIDGTFTLKGCILETLRRDDEIQGVSPTESHWIMTLLGVPVEEAARITALAIDRGECNVSNLRPAKNEVKKDQIQDRALAEMAAVFRRNLFKEASTLGDPKAVDAMLSLNFVNEKNLLQFMENLPTFKEVESKLAELYLYTQLGLKSQIPDQAVLNAMKGVNEVNEHLEYLGAMLRTPASQAQPEPVA